MAPVTKKYLDKSRKKRDENLFARREERALEDQRIEQEKRERAGDQAVVGLNNGVEQSEKELEAVSRSWREEKRKVAHLEQQLAESQNQLLRLQHNQSSSFSVTDHATPTPTSFEQELDRERTHQRELRARDEVAQAAESKNRNLQTQLVKVTAELHAAKSIVKRSKERVSRATREKQSLADQLEVTEEILDVAPTREEYEMLQMENEDFSSLLSAKHAEIVKLQTQLVEARSPRNEQIEQLRERLVRYEIKTIRAEQRVATEAKQHRIDLASKETCIEKVRRELVDLRASSNAEKTQLQREIGDLKATKCPASTPTFAFASLPAMVGNPVDAVAYVLEMFGPAELDRLIRTLPLTKIIKDEVALLKQQTLALRSSLTLKDVELEKVKVAKAALQSRVGVLEVTKSDSEAVLAEQREAIARLERQLEERQSGNGLAVQTDGQQDLARRLTKQLQNAYDDLAELRKDHTKLLMQLAGVEC